MKKSIFVVIGFLVGFTFATAAIADTITIQRISGYYSGNGGEFTIQINNNNDPDLNFVLNFYDSKTKNISNFNPSFQSFCVEYGETVNTGKTYNFTISDRAIKGGVGDAGDPISVGTAWLYFQFARGVLSGYDYIPDNNPNNTTGRDASAKALQEAIWWLEDEQTNQGTGASFLNLLYSALNINDLTLAKKDNNGQYPVRVLNLYYYDDKGNRQLAQDQLVVVPVPATLILLGSGLLGLVGIARRKIRN